MLVLKVSSVENIAILVLKVLRRHRAVPCCDVLNHSIHSIFCRIEEHSVWASRPERQTDRLSINKLGPPKDFMQNIESIFCRR
jgi:hypothetical protein